MGLSFSMFPYKKHTSLLEEGKAKSVGGKLSGVKTLTRRHYSGIFEPVRQSCARGQTAY